MSDDGDLIETNMIFYYVISSISFSKYLIYFTLLLVLLVYLGIPTLTIIIPNPPLGLREFSFP